MDTAQTFIRTLSFLTAGLLVAATGQAATLVVDNSSVPLTGSIQSQNVSVTSSDGSALNFDAALPTYLNPPPGLPLWLAASAAGCGAVPINNCPTPATLSLSVTNDLGQFGGGPFVAKVTLVPHGGLAQTVITVTFYPGPGGIPSAITVAPSISDPVSTVPIAYSTGQLTLPVQQVVVSGTSSYFVSASTLSGGNWLLVSAGGPSGTQIPSTPSSQILSITLNPANVATLATELYQGFVVVTAADGTSSATIDVNLSVNGGVNGAITASPTLLTFAYSTSASPVVIPLQDIVVSAPVGAVFSATTDHPEWIVLPSAAGGNIPGNLQVRISPPLTPNPRRPTPAMSRSQSEPSARWLPCNCWCPVLLSCGPLP